MDAESLIATIDAAAPLAMDTHGVAQVAAGVVASGERVVRGYGAEPETTFRIASITKPLVATLALRLVEAGTLSLDEPVDGPRLPWEGITLRHLLTHQAGLAGDRPQSLADYGEGDDALERLAADVALAGPVGPGELFSYSNFGYWLAGAVAAQAAGTTFEDALQSRVLDPLGMRRTGFGPAEPSVPAPAAYPRARRPSGGLFSCVDDLLHFAEHLLGGRGPLSEESLAAMQTPQVAIDPGRDCGLGLFLSLGRTRPTVEHAGAVPGFRSHLVVVPQERLAVVVLAAGEKGRLDFAHEDASVHFSPAGPRWFFVPEGDDRGETADFPRDGLLRYGWLFERQ